MSNVRLGSETQNEEHDDKSEFEKLLQKYQEEIKYGGLALLALLLLKR